MRNKLTSYIVAVFILFLGYQSLVVVTQVWR
jgi:hypothetical protein